jgi:hypothetical protein
MPRALFEHVVRPPTLLPMSSNLTPGGEAPSYSSLHEHHRHLQLSLVRVRHRSAFSTRRITFATSGVHARQLYKLPVMGAICAATTFLRRMRGSTRVERPTCSETLSDMFPSAVAHMSGLDPTVESCQILTSARGCTVSSPRAAPAAWRNCGAVKNLPQKPFILREKSAAVVNFEQPANACRQCG